ncbi:mechanosensitive ion channel [Lusitaniella coriacea LEGE 07157]|uniref:Mechanosensitive ion channel n=1 Tax=Lusitaniella coriacea LEGE 07157 TaxID=945747 RepID=A0A8J7JCG6_9CYAN|nr:mechanosensitive ion channel domain-containing protein [Lusitaniella coriacea]MBE9117625.1 mechanosensitive ion channel [Lusitaniella coriacea LEGE 07157]
MIENLKDILDPWFQFDTETQRFLIRLGLQLAIFLFFLLLSCLVGRYTPVLVKMLVQRFFPSQVSSVYENLLEPLEKLLEITGTIILISVCLNLIQEYRGLYDFLSFFADLTVIISVAWLVSRFFRQFVRRYGIATIQKVGLEVDEMLLVFETIANLIVGFVAVLAFAQSQNVNLIGLLAGLGIGGIAVAFAAQKTLEQILGTIVLYLDRPFVPGDYIRVSLNPHAEDVYGRIESIGLRSTKLRTTAKGTLTIIPNSTLANLDIENITRGKKVMVLLYLDFFNILAEREQALVEQVVQESTNALFGIDPGSTKVKLFEPEDKPGTRARVTFFILGSSENSIQLRKRLLELANKTISKELNSYEIKFMMQEPTIYVESPMTI